jgi:hypothetical protein
MMDKAKEIYVDLNAHNFPDVPSPDYFLAGISVLAFLGIMAVGAYVIWSLRR